MVRNGGFFRKSDSKIIRRWRCLNCNKTVSDATGKTCFGQNKRRHNTPLRRLLALGMSQRGAARYLRINRKTVARKLIFLGLQARFRQMHYLKQFVLCPVERAQFDELESFVHTKLKPLSVALMVDQNHRKILGFQVSQMPAKGLIARKSREKYGLRPDERADGMETLFHETAPLLSRTAMLTSDQNPKYPGWLKQYPNQWSHHTTKGRRGCIVGQGELKKIGFDPLFSLNHTCAMLRRNVNRLERQTWDTTKKIERLVDHLWIYMDFHNRELTV